MGRRDEQVHVEERRIIGRQVSHLSRLIDDLLDVSRITRGKIELQRTPLDLRSVVAQALEQTQPLFERRAHPVDVQLPAGPAMVEGDAVRLTQVLCNLLVNAAKFTPPDGRVQLAVAARGDRVEVTVTDTGCGIGPELLPHVFDLFVQERQSLARQAGGLGLGLAIVRMLVQLHGGDVGVTSGGPGQGSCFTVRLPALAGATADIPVQTAQVRDSVGAGAGRILIVDDNKDAADTLADLLRLDGYEVRCANEAEAAMAALDSYRPQLALLDIGLPGQDGYALARRMRGDPRVAQAKLVALTGYGREVDRARALQADFDEHLVKPVSADKLLALVQAMIH
jgi:CheY-like chemotaxis protein